MLNYRYTRVIFWLALTAMVVAYWYVSFAWYWFAALVIPYLSLIAYGSSVIQADYYTHSLCQGSTDRKQIAITFDDGPSGDHTTRILDILSQHQVPAAFFVIGKNIIGQEPLLRRMDTDGHLIGNHSFTHNFWFSMKRTPDMLTDMRKCDEQIFKAIGKQPKLFRPPYGVTNPMVAKSIAQGSYTSIGWSVRTFDTVAKDRAKLLHKAISHLKNGDVILFHDWGAHTADILAEFITAARAAHFEITRLDHLLGVKPYI